MTIEDILAIESKEQLREGGWYIDWHQAGSFLPCHIERTEEFILQWHFYAYHEEDIYILTRAYLLNKDAGKGPEYIKIDRYYIKGLPVLAFLDMIGLKMTAHQRMDILAKCQQAIPYSISNS